MIEANAQDEGLISALSGFPDRIRRHYRRY